MRIARAVNWCLQAGLALAAAGLVANAVAAPTSSAETAVDYAPAPASTLLSRRDLPIVLARVQDKGVRKLLLAYEAAGQQRLPLAEISSSTTGGRALMSIHRLPLPGAADPLPLQVVTLEHLYFQAMRLDPEAAFCFSEGERACEPAKDGTSQAALLRDLAAARQRALARTGLQLAGVPWHVVTLGPLGARAADKDDVGARIDNAQGPMQGVKLFFHRAPHSSCVATSGPDGSATCRLVDQHGDGDQHSDDDGARVLVTYPGDVRAERVLLPTTLLLDPS